MPEVKPPAPEPSDRTCRVHGIRHGDQEIHIIGIDFCAEPRTEAEKDKLANEILNHFFSLGARVGYKDFEFIKNRL